jgi:beta-glucosidase
MPTTNDAAANLPISTGHLDELIRSLSVDEKAALTTGIDAWHAGGAPSIGLAPMVTMDGPNGVRGMTAPAGSSATCTPCGTGLGATWDVDLVHEVAARIGLEAKRSGIHYMLGPVINLARSPYGGRVFESFGEDPTLAAELGAAYVTGMQSQGVAACPKHYVANDAEAHRTTVNCIVDERTLREVYLLPFERVAKAGAWSMMSAYNRVNGGYCCDRVDMVRDLLRGEWGWQGVLMSDWHATHDTVAGAVGGLDLEMPGPARYFGPPLAAAVRNGEVDETVLDEKVRRILTVAARVGELPAMDARAAAASDAAPQPGDSGEPLLLSDADGAALVRRAAAESFVLLTNDGTLPLKPAGLRRVAVIGPNAANPCTQGGGAAHIKAPYAVSPLDGLRAALSNADVVHEEGARVDFFLRPIEQLDIQDLDGKPGLTIEFFRGQVPKGEPHTRWHVKSSDLHLFGDLPEGLAQNDFSARMSTWLTPAESGVHTIAMHGFGGRRLMVGGKLAAEEWAAPGAVDIPTAIFEGKESGAEFDLRAGQRVLIEAEIHSDRNDPGLLAIGCRSPEPADLLEMAKAAAASADVAIVVVGHDATWETEGRDRNTVTLPGRQNELVQGVAAANPRTVVVVNAACPVDLPWADKVAAIVYAWFPGQEFGNALADVLLGTAEPGGRLPVTIARRQSDYGALDTTPGPADELVYSEGVNIGYRHFDAAGIEPRFCFGHGLGYTTFEYDSLTLSAEGLTDGRPIELRIRVRNSGDRAGKEVVQVYVSDPVASVPRPPLELKGFSVVRLEPGQTAEVRMALDDRDLAYWDTGRHAWRVEPGRFEIAVGRSSRDIRLRQTLELE